MSTSRTGATKRMVVLGLSAVLFAATRADAAIPPLRTVQAQIRQARSDARYFEQRNMRAQASYAYSRASLLASKYGLNYPVLITGQLQTVGDYLRLGYRNAAAVSFRLAVHAAILIGEKWADTPGSGWDRDEGIRRLRECIAYCQSRTPASFQKYCYVLLLSARTCITRLERAGKRGPRAEAAIHAKARHNRLSQIVRRRTPNANFRGFGDSNRLNEYIPFNFDCNFRMPANLVSLIVEMDVRLIRGTHTDRATEGLTLLGKSGRYYDFRSEFAKLQPGRRTTIRQVIRNADVLAAVKSGRLEGLIQDDSAVYGVNLVFVYETPW